MRIVQITPGTGDFYCGSCLRDNALVRALRARGHDVLMVPLYLPHVTDEPSAAADTPIFLGGINVYLQQKFSLFRHTPAWLDRWLNSPALLRAAAKHTGMTKAKDLGELTISTLQGEQGHQVKEIEKLVAWLMTQPRPDVVCLSNSMLAGMVRRLKQELGVPVVCTLQGEDTFLDGLTTPYRDRAWQILAERCADIDHFIAISRYFGDLMRQRMQLPDDSVTVVYTGIPLEGFEPAPAPPRPPVIGYLARMHPGKGLGTLVDAFIILKQRDRIKDLRLRVAGAKTATDEPYVRSLLQRLTAAKLEHAVEFLPNLDRDAKLRFLSSLSVFSVPATYGEGFGLYVIEALASGVPVVQPRHAAFPELLERTGGGRLCEPDNPASLADALEELLLKPDQATELGRQGRAAVWQHFSIEQMARSVEDVLHAVTKGAATKRGLRV